LNFAQGSNDPTDDDEDIEDYSDTSSELDGGELAERLGEVKDVMNQLYRLSFKIRNTKFRSVTKKALLLKEEDPETGKDLFSTYAIFDRRHIQESLNHLRGLLSSKEFASEPARDPKQVFMDVLDTNGDDFLLDRLAKATTNRRRYFAYWRRHALKLSGVADDPSLQQAVSNPTTFVKSTDSFSKPRDTLPVPGNLMSTLEPKTIVSGTDFSQYNRNLDEQLDTETIISYTTTAYDVDGKSPELPSPPLDATCKSEFLCPYCWVACPSRQGKGKAWQYVSWITMAIEALF